jgi:hypothetical protein
VSLSEARPVVKVDDSTWEGRILVLAKSKGIFSEPLTRGKVQEFLDRNYGERGRPQNIDGALVGLVNKRILERVEDKHAHAWVYSLAGDGLERIKEVSA